MKKLRSVLILTLLLCLLPVCTALAKTGKITASSLNMRKSASTDSKVVGVLREGDKVTIKDSSGSWYKVTKGSKTGYVAKKYVKVTNGSDSGSSSSGSSKKSSKSSGSSDGTCGPGDTGSSVKKVQQRLKKLGYYTGSADGDYGGGTKTAVKNFQKRNGLTVNGTVNKKTLAKLNSSSAKKARASDAAGGSGSGAGSTETLNWFNGGSSKIPKGATFKVKDIKTGIVFTVKRWSGANHIDAEPLTSSDTGKMRKIFGHWSWRRRAILVKYNGHVYAASMNGMPHGTQTIRGNNFDGHFCIHFYGSKTHGSRKVDAMHQNCVAEAMKHSW
jgi:peptidoglycan hydrolase-like protein with peptidoglycan-binding domain